MRASFAIVLSACATAGDVSDAGPAPDAARSAPDGGAGADAAGPTPDAAPTGDAAPVPDARRGDGGGVAYRHTIDIDGANDFDGAADAFATTSPSYGAFVSWDDDALYLGYAGGDIASGDASRWLLVHLDVDPGAATGATVGETYNTQQTGFPGGFGAEYYVRWRASNDLFDLQVFDGTAWAPAPADIAVGHAGEFVEVAIPLAALGAPSTVGVATLMINETPLAEGAYAGLYAGSFADGYYPADTAPIPTSSYLRINRASPAAPNDAANRRP